MISMNKRVLILTLLLSTLVLPASAFASTGEDKSYSSFQSISQFVSSLLGKNGFQQDLSYYSGDNYEKDKGHDRDKDWDDRQDKDWDDWNDWWDDKDKWDDWRDKDLTSFDIWKKWFCY